MPIKPVSGEIKSQDINNNLSYLDSMMSNPLSTAMVNGEKVSMDLLSTQVLQAMTGNTPISLGLQVNKGVVYPLKNLVKGGTTYPVATHISNLILDVKVLGAKKGKLYSIDWIGNGISSNGENRYSIAISEFDKGLYATNGESSRRRLVDFRNTNFPAPTETVVTRSIEIEGEGLTFVITYDRTAFESRNFVAINYSDTNGDARGAVIDEVSYFYSNNTVLSNDANNPFLVCQKLGSNHRVQFSYNQEKSMIVDFDKLGINQIIHMRRIYLANKLDGKLDFSFGGGTLIKDIDTDWISPYGLTALTNPLNSNSFTTGGNHGTNSASGFPTAKNVSVKMFADDKVVNDGETLSANEKVVIQVVNYVSAANVIDTTTGQKRDSVAEYVTYTIRPRTIDVSVTLEAIEETRLNYYLGIQAEKEGPWYKKLYYMPDSSPTIFDIEMNTAEGNSGLYPNSKADRFVMKKDQIALIGYRSNDIGMGRSTMIDGQKVFRHTANLSGKVYGHLVGNPVTLKTGDTVFFSGSFTITEPLECPGAETAYVISDGQRKVYCVDFFNATSNTFLKVDEIDYNKRIEVIEKSASVTVDNFISSKGLKMSSTGYGQLKFRVI